MIERHLVSEQLPLLFDAFWQVLPFGTGGRRGRVGYGANRLNQATVAVTIQGHCNFLRGRFPGRSDLTVVVANDVRVFRDIAGVYGFLGPDHPLLGLSSRGLAKLACEIYAGNGIAAFLGDPEDDDAGLATPELSFAIGVLEAVGGVNLSASHNPPDDNGVKVFDEFGSQPVAPEDQQLLDIMAGVTEVKSLPFGAALSAGLIRPIPRGLHAEYVRGYVKLYQGFFAPRPDIPIVYTPLCGVGPELGRGRSFEPRFPRAHASRGEARRFFCGDSVPLAQPRGRAVDRSRRGRLPISTAAASCCRATPTPIGSAARSSSTRTARTQASPRSASAKRQ